MGKRSSAKKPQTRVKLTLDKTFKCMFCQHNGTITCKIDNKTKVGRLDCKDCAQHFETDINHLTEPIDIYAEWIDACRAVNPEGTRLQHRGQAPAVVRSNPTSTQGTNAAGGKKRRGSHDDDQEEEDEDEDDLPNPVGQRKKRRALDEDENEDEEEDEQEEDRDLPEPVGKNRVGVPQQVEEEDGDDDDDLPEPQGRKNRPGVVVDDEEDG
ncbi:BQ5605_C025g10058 [Microbotryum silenes-dioicae]|uniref:Transcription elongation factor 1 homolog n=1 Tax=Microbotryum silenes-dioicae TaxID=796604 RepID=A0A2X0N8M3_9BASI|nr:BQ5605_C025g10058 [Microbotryum silenes-dioicae]